MRTTLNALQYHPAQVGALHFRAELEQGPARQSIPTWQQWPAPLQSVPQVLSQHANINQLTQGLEVFNTYGGDEILSLMGPKAAMVAPWIGPGYIGLDIYNQAKQAYTTAPDLPRQERIRQTAIKTGDVALIHALATVGIPLLFAKNINTFVHQAVKLPKTPSWLAKKPNWVAAAVLFSAMLILAKPIQWLVNFTLDWTYRPLLERKRRQEVQKAIQAQWDRQLQFFQSSPLLNKAGLPGTQTLTSRSGGLL